MRRFVSCLEVHEAERFLTRFRFRVDLCQECRHLLRELANTFVVLFFKSVWRDVTQRTMDSLTVVEELNVFEHILLCLGRESKISCSK